MIVGKIKRGRAPVDKIQLKITKRRSCPCQRAFPKHNDPNDDFIKGNPESKKRKSQLHPEFF